MKANCMGLNCTLAILTSIKCKVMFARVKLNRRQTTPRSSVLLYVYPKRKYSAVKTITGEKKYNVFLDDSLKQSPRFSCKKRPNLKIVAKSHLQG